MPISSNHNFFLQQKEDIHIYYEILRNVVPASIYHKCPKLEILPQKFVHFLFYKATAPG